jgi:hypothetical protein
MVTRFCRRPGEREDLEQVVQIALLRGLERFDPDRQVEFSTFAWGPFAARSSVITATIRGACGYHGGCRRRTWRWQGRSTWSRTNRAARRRCSRWRATRDSRSTQVSRLLARSLDSLRRWADTERAATVA